MKRSNRLVLLIGVFLAVIAFIAVIFIQQKPPEEKTPTTQATVVAAVNIPLGVNITADMVKEVQLPPEGRSASRRCSRTPTR